MSTVHLSCSRTVAVPPKRAFEVVLPHPLTELFAHRFLAIPPIVEVRGQQGPWATVGQTRTIITADGGRLEETLTEVAAPDTFGYDIALTSGPLALLATGAAGRWTFTPTAGPSGIDAGTTMTWAWDLQTTPVGRVLMPLFGAMWRGYARRALSQAAALLSA